MGPGKMLDRIQRMFPRGKGWRPCSPERGTPTPWWGTGPSHRSVRSSMGEIEDKVPCRDTYPFEGNCVRENTGSGVEGTLIWTENHTPFMVDPTPSLENEKVYDRDAEDKH